MELKEMTVDQLEERKAAIPAELDNEDADLDALEAEVKGINEELESRKAAEAKRVEIRAAVAEGAGEVRAKVEEVQEVKPMSNTEIRNSEEYINAYAKYIKTNDATECRALLSENAEGVVPVPEYIEGRVRTAWENSDIMSLVRKTFVKGNLKIGFEVSADGAVIHEEGGDPVTPENLVIGTVTLIPQSIKKLIQISDEALDLSGREFLDYLYDELTYQLVKKAETELIKLIVDAPETVSASGVGCPIVALSGATLSIADIVTAEGELSPEATNPVIVTTRQNAAALKNAAIAANYAVDPFDGMNVFYVGSAALGGYDAIVGDFALGAHANYPSGAEIQIKFDDRTDMASDLVNILGRQFVGFGLVADKAFVRIGEADSE